MAFTLERSCEEMIFSVDSQKAVPAPFLTKTYELVDDPLTNHIVSWGDDETSFVVWRPPEFARDLLPNYFKHSNFSSFVRQLNTYGFKKVVADRWEFTNEYFKKGAKHLLSEIQRRKNPNHHHHQQQQQENQPHFHDQPPQYFLQPEDHQHSYHWNIDPPFPPSKPSTDADILTALSEDNQRLRRENYMLLSELSHMKNLYNDIIYFIQTHVKPVNVAHEQKAQNGMAAKLVELGSPCEQDQTVLGKSSLALVAEESINGTASSVKLFGVPLRGKKRLHPEVIHH